VDLAHLTPAASATFKHAASMTNPKFYELQRPRKSTWDIPRFVRGYDITLDDHLILPRGLRHTIAAIVERAGSGPAVTDLRNPGHEVDLTFTAKLDTKQAVAAHCSATTTATCRRLQDRQNRSLLQVTASNGFVVGERRQLQAGRVRSSRSVDRDRRRLRIGGGHWHADRNQSPQSPRRA